MKKIVTIATTVLMVALTAGVAQAGEKPFTKSGELEGKAKKCTFVYTGKNSSGQDTYEYVCEDVETEGETPKKVKGTTQVRSHRYRCSGVLLKDKLYPGSCTGQGTAAKEGDKEPITFTVETPGGKVLICTGTAEQGTCVEQPPPKTDDSTKPPKRWSPVTFTVKVNSKLFTCEGLLGGSGGQLVPGSCKKKKG